MMAKKIKMMAKKIQQQMMGRAPHQRLMTGLEKARRLRLRRRRRPRRPVMSVAIVTVRFAVEMR